MARHSHIVLVLKTKTLEIQTMIEQTFTIETVYTSDCCGEYCCEDTQICLACGEHCEVVTENVEVAC